MKWKVSEIDYKFVERNVTLYRFYKQKIEDEARDIAYSTPERDSNGGGKSNIPGRPTERMVMQMIDNPQMEMLKKYVRCIEQAYYELDEEKQRFVEKLFWSRSKRSIYAICKEFSIKESTYRRWKKAFLFRVAELTGDMFIFYQ